MKLRAVGRARGRAIVVANGCESEPLSAKDALLLRELPHLVLDGAALAARAVGAERRSSRSPRATSAIARQPRATRSTQRRRGALDDAAVRAVRRRRAASSPGRRPRSCRSSTAGRRSPTFIPPRPTERGVRRRPTLIQNVETLAHLALIARHGAELVPRGRHRGRARLDARHAVGAVAAPGVYEIERGTPLARRCSPPAA